MLKIKDWLFGGLFCMIGLGFFFLRSEAQAAVEYTGRSFGDPFDSGETTGAPLDADKGAAEISSMSLEGLVWGAKYPQAIINGQVVTLGSTVEGFEVVAIDKTGVQLRTGGREVHLRIKRKGAK